MFVCPFAQISRTGLLYVITFFINRRNSELNIISAVAIAFVLDILFGDPIKIPHIVVAIGKLISLLEKGIRKLLPKTN